MHFVPWKTIDLDGAFRITAPDSISEEVIQEVSNGITFKFNGKLEKTKLEILLTCLLYTSPSPRDYAASRMPSSA